MNFAEGEATKVADLKKFKLTKELAIAQAEMNAITKVEERRLDLNDGNGAILPGFLTKDDLLQNSANRVTYPKSGCGSDWITHNTH